jgi:WD repeat-containing protein 23
MSVGWANRRSGSIVARHEWKGLSKLGHRLEDWVDRESAEYAERTRPRPTNVRIPGAFVDDEDDEAWTDDE